jgi:hypothetical protein
MKYIVFEPYEASMYCTKLEIEELWNQLKVSDVTILLKSYQGPADDIIAYEFAVELYRTKVPQRNESSAGYTILS